MSTPLRERPDAPLGTLIFRAGLLPAETIESALEEGVKTGKRLGEILTERGLISEVDLARLLAGQKGLEFVTLREQIVDPAAAALFTEEQARLFRALPYSFDGELPIVAIADPTDDVLIRNIREALGREDARFVVTARGELAEISADVYANSPQPAPPTEPASSVEAAQANGHSPAVETEIAFEPPAPAEPEAAGPEPDPVAAEPAPVAPEPDPVAAEPVVTEPEPVLTEPEPVVAEPELPEPVAAEPELPEPELPEPVAAPEPPFVPEPQAAPAAPDAEAAVEPRAVEEPVFSQPPAQAEAPAQSEPAPLSDLSAEPEPLRVADAPAPPEPAEFEAPAAASSQPAAGETVTFPQPAPPVPEPPHPPAAVGPAPEPEPVPTPVVEPVAAPSPPAEQDPAGTLWRMTIRLTNGERVEAGEFADEASAKQEAKTVMMQIAAADTDDWPFVNGRFLKPDTIVSVDIAESDGNDG